jgi:hypothetical protein
MKRVAMFIRMWLVSVLALPAFASVATAQRVAPPTLRLTPPTLSGESFHGNAPALISATCSAAKHAGTFRATGTATGPYPGTFQEVGHAVVTIDRTTGHVIATDLTAFFSIASSVGRVLGTTHSTNIGSGCSVDPNSPPFFIGFIDFNTVLSGGFFATDTYSAKVVTPSGLFGDNGLFTVQFFIPGNAAFPPGSFDESFVSALASPQQLLPSSKS